MRQHEEMVSSEPYNLSFYEFIHKKKARSFLIYLLTPPPQLYNFRVFGFFFLGSPLS